MELDSDNEDDNVIGIRQSRRLTNWLHRYDALSQTEIARCNNLQSAFDQMKINRKKTFIILILLHYILQSINNNNNNARFCYTIMLIYLCYQHDRIQAVRRELEDMILINNTDRISHLFTQRKNRSIQEVTESNCYLWTRFTRQQLHLLLLHLRIPAVVRPPVSGGRRSFSGEEVLIISLTKIFLGLSFITMESFFGGNPRDYSSVFHWFINHIFCTFYNKILGNSLEMWVNQVDEFRRIICNRISHPPTQIELEIDPTLVEDELLGISFDDFRCWGFIDATDFRTTRTGSGPQPDGSRRAYAYELQREFYSRYFRAHGIKYLSVLLPNGLTGAVFGASLSTNDNGMINLSGISDYLLQLLNPMHSHGLFPTLFGDSIMQLTPVIQSYCRIQNGRNTVWRKRMASSRMCIELDYGLLFNNFRIMIREEAIKI
jgi:hypothetical protein